MKQKILIMRKRVEVTDEEIERYKNFEDLVVRHERLVTRSRWGKFAAGAAIVTVIATVAYLYVASRSVEIAEKPESAPKQEIIVPDSKESHPDSLSKSHDSIAVARKSFGAGIVKGGLKKNTQEKITADSAQKTAERTVDYKYLEARPVDGFPALYEYFNRELRYPQAAVRDSLEGVVTVFFIIDKQGNALNISVQNSLGPLFDEEAYRLISNMPPWMPATVNGKPIAAKISIPLTFKIQRSVPEKN